MKNYIFLGLFLICGATTASADTQYRCTFNSEIKVTDLNVKSPKSTIKKINEKYTFWVEKNKASYINLSHGLKSDLEYLYQGVRLMFIEKTSGDNNFVVTIFYTRKEAEGFPAVFSYTGWNRDIPFYNPSIALGYCN